MPFRLWLVQMSSAAKKSGHEDHLGSSALHTTQAMGPCKILLGFTGDRAVLSKGQCPRPASEQRRDWAPAGHH
eukprot:5669949-Amphidinium_carterae.1